MLGVDALVLGDDDLAGLVGDIEPRGFAAQPLRHELHKSTFGAQREGIEAEEMREHLLVGKADGLQQNRRRHLAAAIDAEVKNVLGVELEVEPRAAIRNHARGEQQLAARMRLAAIVFEEHAGRTMQLRHDYALGAVDDERAGGRHQRNFAHVDLLLLNFLDRRLRRLAVHDDQPHLGAQRRRIGQTALLAFLDVKRRLAKLKTDELEPRHAVMAGDREDRRESGLQAVVFTLTGRDLSL